MHIQLKDFISLTVPHYCLFYISIPLSLILFSQSLANAANFIIPVLSLCLTLMGLNTINMVFDFELDKLNKPTRPLPAKRVTKKQAQIMSVLLILFSIIILLPISFFLPIVNIFLILMFLIYSHPKIYFKKYILSSFIFGGIFYGLIPILLTKLILKNIEVQFAIIYIIMIMIIASIKDIEDIDGEIKFKVKSIPQKIGSKNLIKLTFISLNLILGYIFILGILNIYPIAFSIISLISIIIIYTIFKTEKTEDYLKITTQSKLLSKLMFIINIIFISFGIIAYLFL
jgi:geranylgeranylglycerol-phosphate geranylgeranyltransferase